MVTSHYAILTPYQNSTDIGVAFRQYPTPYVATLKQETGVYDSPHRHVLSVREILIRIRHTITAVPPNIHIFFLQYQLKYQNNSKSTLEKATQ